MKRVRMALAVLAGVVLIGAYTAAPQAAPVPAPPPALPGGAAEKWEYCEIQYSYRAARSRVAAGARGGRGALQALEGWFPLCPPREARPRRWPR